MFCSLYLDNGLLQKHTLLMEILNKLKFHIILADKINGAVSTQDFIQIFSSVLYSNIEFLFNYAQQKSELVRKWPDNNNNKNNNNNNKMHLKQWKKKSKK